MAATAAAPVPNAEYGQVILIKRDGNDAPAFTLSETKYMFGRQDYCDIRINIKEVSREHAELVVDEKQKVWLINLSKSNPTLINDEEVTGRVRVKHNDIINIAGRCFRYESPSMRNGSAKKRTPLAASKSVNIVSSTGQLHSTPTRSVINVAQEIREASAKKSSRRNSAIQEEDDENNALAMLEEYGSFEMDEEVSIISSCASPGKDNSFKRLPTPLRKAIEARRSATPAKTSPAKKAATPAKKAATPAKAEEEEEAVSRTMPTPLRKAIEARRVATPAKKSPAKKAATPAKKSPAKKAATPVSHVLPTPLRKAIEARRVATPAKKSPAKKAATPAKAEEEEEAVSRTMPTPLRKAIEARRVATPAKKSPAKSPAKESPAKKSPAKSPAKESPAKKSPAKSPAKESPAKKPEIPPYAPTETPKKTPKKRKSVLMCPENNDIARIHEDFTKPIIKTPRKTPKHSPRQAGNKRQCEISSTVTPSNGGARAAKRARPATSSPGTVAFFKSITPQQVEAAEAYFMEAAAFLFASPGKPAVYEGPKLKEVTPKSSAKKRQSVDSLAGVHPIFQTPKAKAEDNVTKTPKAVSAKKNRESVDSLAGVLPIFQTPKGRKSLVDETEVFEEVQSIFKSGAEASATKKRQSVDSVAESKTPKGKKEKSEEQSLEADATANVPKASTNSASTRQSVDSSTVLKTPKGGKNQSKSVPASPDVWVLAANRLFRTPQIAKKRATAVESVFSEALGVLFGTTVEDASTEMLASVQHGLESAKALMDEAKKECDVEEEQSEVVEEQEAKVEASATKKGRRKSVAVAQVIEEEEAKTVEEEEAKTVEEEEAKVEASATRKSRRKSVAAPAAAEVVEEQEAKVEASATKKGRRKSVAVAAQVTEEEEAKTVEEEEAKVEASATRKSRRKSVAAPAAAEVVEEQEAKVEASATRKGRRKSVATAEVVEEEEAKDVAEEEVAPASDAKRRRKSVAAAAVVEAPNAKIASTRRRSIAVTASVAAPARKTRRSVAPAAIVEEVEDNAVESPVEESMEDLSKLRVVDLQSRLKALGMDAKGKKAELIARLESLGTEPKSAGKRKAADKDEVAVEEVVAEEEEVAEMSASALGKLRVVDLMELLTAKGLDTSKAKKADLIARLVASAESAKPKAPTAPRGRKTVAFADSVMSPAKRAKTEPVQEEKPKRGRKSVAAKVEPSPPRRTTRSRR